MKYTSAIFLVILLAQTVFATEKVFELLEKTEEGRGVLENLLLQLNLEGKNLNPRAIHRALSRYLNSLRKVARARRSRIRLNERSCKKDIMATKNMFFDLTNRAIIENRHRKIAIKRKTRRNRFIHRARLSLIHYRHLFRYLVASRNQWGRFMKRAIKGNRTISGYLRKIFTLLSGKGRAFVQLPDSHENELMEMKSQVDASFDTYDGLKPAISNIIELVQNRANLTKPNFRARARSLVRHLLDRLSNIRSNYLEENEKQKQVFKSLILFFNGAKNRAVNYDKALMKHNKRANQRIRWMTKAVRGANKLAKDGEKVVNQRREECRWEKEREARLQVELARALSVVRNLQDVIADRWGRRVKSFFLQKLQTETN